MTILKLRVWLLLVAFILEKTENITIVKYANKLDKDIYKRLEGEINE